jgi:hypothetical protein
MSDKGWAKIRRQVKRFSDALAPGGVDRRSAFQAELTPSLATRVTIGRFDAIEDLKDELGSLYLWLWNAKDHLAFRLHETGKVQTRQAAGRMVDDYVNQHRALRLVADVANTEKHAELSRSRSGSFARIGGYTTVMPVFIEPYSLKGTEAEVKRRSRSYVRLVDANGETIGDAVAVASEALALWQAFVDKHHIGS